MCDGDGCVDSLGAGACVVEGRVALRVLACSKAVTKERMEAKRSSGFLVCAVKMTCSTAGGSEGRCSISEGGGVTLWLVEVRAGARSAKVAG